MQYTLKTFEQNRNNILALLEEHSLSRVNTIPQGFNNNLIWNAGHLLLSHQYLLYHLSGLPTPDYMQEIISKYGAGAIPDGQASQKEFDLITENLRSSEEQLIADYKKGRFKTFKAYTSDYFGVTMNNIEEAIQFTTYHEAFHLGFMTAIKLGV